MTKDSIMLEIIVEEVFFFFALFKQSMLTVSVTKGENMYAAKKNVKVENY